MHYYYYIIIMNENEKNDNSNNNDFNDNNKTDMKQWQNTDLDVKSKWFWNLCLLAYCLASSKPLLA